MVWHEPAEGSMDIVWNGRGVNEGMVWYGRGVNGYGVKRSRGQCGYGVKRSRGQWILLETVELLMWVRCEAVKGSTGMV